MIDVFRLLFASGFAGTPGYLSPEVLRKDPYGKPVDIWACGESPAAAPPPHHLMEATLLCRHIVHDDVLSKAPFLDHFPAALVLLSKTRPL